MKTTNCLSSLLVCSVLLTVGCSRTNPSSSKPAPAAKPAAEQQAPQEVPVTDTLDLSGNTASSSAPNGSDVQRPDATVGEADAPLAPVVAPAAEVAPTEPTITGLEVLQFIDSQKLPLVAPFAAPKYDKKDAVRFLVGNKCSSIIAVAKKKGGVGNLASKVDKSLCNTNILRTGSPKVTVVPKKYISRETNYNYIAGASNVFTEVLLRADGTVAAIKTSTKTRGVFQRSSNERIEIATPQGNSLVSDRNPSTEILTFENKDGSIRYEAIAKAGSRYAPSKIQKSLVVKNFKGLNLSVVEKAESDHSTVLGRVVKASVRCNILAIDKNLNTAFGATVEGRCFHRN